VIALTAGIALLIGWYRGFNVRSLELAAAVFAVVLAIQIIVLVVTHGEIGSNYWPIVGAVAVGWLGCVWVGSRARRSLRP
jgi:membrane protein YdbS with pleckstrin-like domain